MSYYITSLVLRGSLNALYWSSGSIIYMVTPNAVYNTANGIYYWWYPPQTDSQKLIEELKEINKHLIELKESGVVLVNKDGTTKELEYNNLLQITEIE
jgi:hypothetical protein